MSAKPPPSQPASSTDLRHNNHRDSLKSTTTIHWSSHPPSPAKIFTSTATNSTNTSIATTTTSTQNYDNTLLNLLRQRKTEDAWIAYTQSPHLPNPTCLSRLICQLSYQNTSSALTRAQSIIQRLRRERQLHRLDSNSLGLLAVAAAKSGDTLYANSILKSMLRSGYLPHVKAWSAVVSRLASSGDDGPKEAVKLFSQVTRTIRRFGDPALVINSRPDTAAYNAVLNACANLGWTEKFLQLFDEMPESNCEPDVLTYNIMIKLCASCDRKDLLVFVLERILEKEIPLCMTTFQSLVASYIGFDDLETAEKIVQAMRDGRKDLCKILRESNMEEFEGDDAGVFEKLLPNMNYLSDYEPPLLKEVFKPNTRMYTTLMKGYMKAGRIKDTVRMLEAMRSQEDSDSRPDHVTYTTVVSALVNVGSMEKAKQVLTEMSKAGIQANRVTYNILLKGYCQQLQIDNAKETIKEMIDVGIEPDAVSYNTLIDGCILIDDCAGALVFFNEMRSRNIAPTKISYTTLMKAFSVSGQPKLAHDVFNEMEKDPRVKVDLVAWNMLIEAYSRLGMLDFAKETVENMKKKGVYPDVATYGSLANCIALARKPGEALLLWNEIKERCGLINDEIRVSKFPPNVPDLKPDEGLLDTLADICVRAAFFKKSLEIVAFMEELGIAPNKTKYTRIYVEMHSRMFTSKHASRARQDRRIEKKRAAEAFKFWLGLPNSYYGSEWRLEGEGGDGEDEYAI
ncbi:pentatricopeptide repeat-containing protein At3g09650, chloroplastic-like [Rutidosis leptorrhynchoides]|uniref:pentatricopeptide repeat-containing protein At3g09650, chloroplastic-like n=1 Tax=Rutidosis leptorrhynchoides TaxID=125765 RepID=UPI003A99C178